MLDELCELIVDISNNSILDAEVYDKNRRGENMYSTGICCA